MSDEQQQVEGNWITIEQAAVALGLSVRTVNRHINAGKLQSRLSDGRREVLIENSTPGAAAQLDASETYVTQVVASTANEGVDYESVLALADSAADKAELAVSAYQALARSADDRVRTTRRWSYAAWSLVAMLTIGTVVSVAWASSRLTRVTVENEQLRRQVAQNSDKSESADRECDDLRRALSAAREDAARAEGRLAGYSEKRQTSPSTRPTLTDRIASIFDSSN
jgi:hypothetical protein